MRSTRVLATGLVALVACAAGPAPHESLERRIVEAAERVKPAVVHIEAIVKFNNRRNQVTGSGVIVDPTGAILTNEHVVDNAEKVTVSVPGTKRRFTAEVVGTDRQTDIALLRIARDTPFPAAKLGSGDSLRVGQWVLAVGNPYGLDGTVSFGIVSAKGRDLEVPHLLNDFIQTDAMIDRGSSGGPLIDLEGRVVGINSRGQGRGIGFTIPIETAREVMRQLEGGGIARGYLGVSLQPLDRELADYFGLPEATGVVLNSVAAGSPASAAGLLPGDILTRFDGMNIEAEQDEDLGSFQRRVAAVNPGQKVAVEYIREGEAKRADVAIGTQPKVDAAEVETEFGFHAQEITENVAREQRLDSSEGVFVVFVERGSPAEEAGLAVGDVIERLEEQRVTSLDDFQRGIESVAELERFLLTTRRGEERKFLLLHARTARASEGDAAEPLAPPSP
jgi:S1-C subfamily serine protease